MEAKQVSVGLFLSVLLLSSLIVVSDIGVNLFENKMYATIKSTLTDYTPHGPIEITDDSNFTTLGFTGNGLPGDPYIIENLSIVSDADDCIKVQDTTSHFVIRNCYITSNTSSGLRGIYFSNVDNGTIENCSVTWKEYAVIITSSSDCVIDKISISNVADTGIHSTGSAYCNVTNSYIDARSTAGYVVYEDSNYALYYNCTIVGGQDGIYMGGVSQVLDSCTIRDYESRGVYLTGATTPTIRHSSIQGGDLGIYSGPGNTRIIHNNTISHNDIGIHFYHTMTSNITGNKIFQTQYYGIWFFGISQDNHVFGNQFGWNNPNAYDETGRMNYFDDEDSIGNAWHDYSGTGTYTPSGASDDDSWPTILSDSVAPTGSPAANTTFGQGTTGNSVTWDVFDEWPDSFTVYINDVPTVNPWFGGDIVVSLDHLTQGIHNVTVVVTDCGGYSISDTIFADVYLFDLVTLEDIDFESGTTDHWLDWSARCVFPMAYEIQVDGVLDSSGVWDGSDISFNVDHLPLGSNQVLLNLTNSTGYQLLDYVNVEVYDTLAPIVTDLGYYVYELGFPKQITWTADDANPATFEILKNGSTIHEGPWYGGEIEILVPNLEAGLFNYTIVLTDVADQISIDTMFILVSDTTAPTLSHPDDVVVEEGILGESIAWIADDYSNGTFSVLVDGTEHTSGSSLTETIEILTSSFSAGIYNVTLVATDSSGNSASDTVWLTVDANLAPVVVGPTSLEMSEGQLGVWIRWNCSDANPASYRILIDDATVESGEWDGYDIFFALANLPQGTYNVSLVVSDVQGIESSFTVEVVVQQVVTTTTTTTTSTTTTTTNNTILTDVINQLGALNLALIVVGGVAVFSVIVSVILLVGSKRGS